MTAEKPPASSHASQSPTVAIMPDSDTNLNIVIRTQADLAGAKAAAAQLEEDIARAKELGLKYHEIEIQLEAIREDVQRLPLTNTPPAPKTPVPAPAGETPEGMFGSFASSLLGAVQKSIAAAQQATATIVEREKKSPPLPANQPTNATPTNLPPKLPGVPITQDSGDAGDASTAFVSSADRPAAIPAIPGGADFFADNSARAASAFSPPNFGDGEFAVNAQTQSLQAAGERLRAAVEQNGLITQSLFQRTLDVIDGQNRKLSDLDRRLSELGNQIKSLKNP